MTLNRGYKKMETKQENKNKNFVGGLPAMDFIVVEVIAVLNEKNNVVKVIFEIDDKTKLTYTPAIEIKDNSGLLPTTKTMTPKGSEIKVTDLPQIISNIHSTVKKNKKCKINTCYSELKSENGIVYKFLSPKDFKTMEIVA